MADGLLVVGRNVAVTICLVLQHTIFQGEGEDAGELASLHAALGGGVGDIDDRDGKATVTGILAVGTRRLLGEGSSRSRKGKSSEGLHLGYYIEYRENTRGFYIGGGMVE